MQKATNSIKFDSNQYLWQPLLFKLMVFMLYPILYTYKNVKQLKFSQTDTVDLFSTTVFTTHVHNVHIPVACPNPIPFNLYVFNIFEIICNFASFSLCRHENMQNVHMCTVYTWLYIMVYIALVNIYQSWTSDKRHHLNKRNICCRCKRVPTHVFPWRKLCTKKGIILRHVHMIFDYLFVCI